jgi:cell wall-associated NlpC family hydrolase
LVVQKDEIKDLSLNTKSLNKKITENKAKARKEEKKRLAELKKLIKTDSLNAITNRKSIDSMHLAYEKNLQRKNIIEKAEEFLGTKYYFGGMTKNGIDCSALIYNAFSENLIDVPRTSRAQAKIGKRVKKEKAKPGDLIFFRTTSKFRITHVGIITENNDGQIKFIHASSSQGVTISSLENSYYKKTFAKIKRLL